jgi:hypothetical protein
MEDLMRRSCMIALLGVLACGDDDGSGPSTPVEITGSWSTTLSNLSGDGVLCNSTTPTLLTLTQTETALTGSYSGGSLTCSGPGGTATLPVNTGSVINGQVTGNQVSFDLGTQDFHHEGTVSGTTSMSGDATWTIDFGPSVGSVTLTGTWAATRQ